MWLVSSGEGLMCTNLRSKSRVAWLLILDTAGSHGGYMMSWSLDPTDKHLWFLMVVFRWESSLLARVILLNANNEVWL